MPSTILKRNLDLTVSFHECRNDKHKTELLYGLSVGNFLSSTQYRKSLDNMIGINYESPVFLRLMLPKEFEEGHHVVETTINLLSYDLFFMRDPAVQEFAERRFREIAHPYAARLLSNDNSFVLSIRNYKLLNDDFRIGRDGPLEILDYPEIPEEDRFGIIGELSYLNAEQEMKGGNVSLLQDLLNLFYSTNTGIYIPITNQ